MNCFECSADGGRVAPAVAICSACGAAVCSLHVIVDAAQLNVPSVGRPAAVPIGGRRLHCRVCALVGPDSTEVMPVRRISVSAR